MAKSTTQTVTGLFKVAVTEEGGRQAISIVVAPGRRAAIVSPAQAELLARTILVAVENTGRRFGAGPEGLV